MENSSAHQPMKGLNSWPVNGHASEQPGCGVSPAALHGGNQSINIKVSYGSDDHEFSVPSNSTFGELNSLIAQKLGLTPGTHKLLFRGKDKEENEYLEMAGVKNNAKVLLVEDTSSTDRSVEGANEPQSTHDVKQAEEISKGGEAVAIVQEEVNGLSEQVSALKAVVESGTKVQDKDIIYLTEMLMRQLLKLDSIDAEGEGRVQRRTEVRRIQNLMEAIDVIKATNSNPFVNSNTVSVTTNWETFGSTDGSQNAPPPVAPSSTKITEDWEQFD